MRNLACIAFFGALLLQTGCAVDVTASRPRLPTIIIGEAPPPPAPLPPPPPPPQRLARAEAVAIAQSWCRHNGYACWLDEAHLSRGHQVWKVKFDASRPGNSHPACRNARGRGAQKHCSPTSGRLHLEIDAWSGHLLDVDAKGRLRHG